MQSSKNMELCGISLEEKIDEKKLIVKKKEIIPGGDYWCDIINPPKPHKKFFHNYSIIFPIKGKTISMVYADNGGGYSSSKCIDKINELNDYYYYKYCEEYEMYYQELVMPFNYVYYFYPPNYNVIPFENPESAELKPVTCLWLGAEEEQYQGYYKLIASLFHYEDSEDDKYPEETFEDKKTELKVISATG